MIGLSPHRGSIGDKTQTRVYRIIEETGPEIVTNRTGLYPNGSFFLNLNLNLLFHFFDSII